MTTVAITGATGHVGSNLVRQLVARGDTVRALTRNPDPVELRGLSVEKVAGDVSSGQGLDALLDGAELVFHLAAQISIVGPMNGLVHKVNVDGARNVAAAAKRAGVRRMVHCCSVHVFEPAPFHEPTDEARARVQRGEAPAYDVSKAEGEAVVRQAVAEGLDAVIVHPSGVMGPYDFKPSRMGHVLLKLYRRRLPALLAGGFDWVDARDVSAGMLAAAERGRTGESYLLTGHYRTVAQVADVAQSITGVPGRAWCAPSGSPRSARRSWTWPHGPCAAASRSTPPSRSCRSSCAWPTTAARPSASSATRRGRSRTPCAMHTRGCSRAG